MGVVNRKRARWSIRRERQQVAFVTPSRVLHRDLHRVADRVDVAFSGVQRLGKRWPTRSPRVRARWQPRPWSGACAGRSVFGSARTAALAPSRRSPARFPSTQHPDLQRLLRHGHAKHRVAVTSHHSIVLDAGAEAAPMFVSAAISAIGVPIVLASSQDDVALPAC